MTAAAEADPATIIVAHDANEAFTAQAARVLEQLLVLDEHYRSLRGADPVTGAALTDSVSALREAMRRVR